MSKMEEYKVSYIPAGKRVSKILANTPIEAAYQFFKENPEYQVILVQKNLFNREEYFPKEFIGEFDDAEEFIKSNFPEYTPGTDANKIKSRENDHLLNWSTANTFDNWKLRKGEFIFQIIAVIVVIAVVLVLVDIFGLPKYFRSFR